jgi:Putative metallopeptidase/Caspase domain
MHALPGLSPAIRLIAKLPLTRVAMVLAVICAIGHSTGAAAQSPPAPPATPDFKSNQVEILYAAPRTSKYLDWQERLSKRGVLEEMQQFLAALKLPRTLKLAFHECGMINVYYRKDIDTVVLCYEFAEFLDRAGGPDANRMATLLYVTFHEVAHGMFHMWQIPIFGAEEDAADRLGMFMVLQLGNELARRAVDGTIVFYDEIAATGGHNPADQHGSPAQRKFTIMCMAYGAAPDAFRDFVDKKILPEMRAWGCSDEFQQVKTAYTKLFDPDMLARLNGGEWAQSNPGSGRVVITLGPDLTAQVISSQSITLDGGAVKIEDVDRSMGRVTLSGNVPKPSDSSHVLGYKIGNVVQTLRLLWELNQLQAFLDPYPTSYAILVAIDDYDRTKDRRWGGPTGFRKLTGMVDRAKELKEVLIRRGFPADNIKTLYDEQATKDDIEKALYEFWEGGKSAKRLFFYFGGHGANQDGRGYLVTYNFDRARPTQSGFLMSDIVGRHFANIEAHHVLFAIDSCFSGLAVPGTLSGETDERTRKELSRLANIRAAVVPKARNLLVAGTGKQEALWENGGVFTRALVDGLNGDADLDKNKIILFDELAYHIKTRVIEKTAETGFDQVPSIFNADAIGNGRTLFLMPEER